MRNREELFELHAIILAAGMGKRLKDLTSNNTKCMVKVNGITLIERMLTQLDKLNLSKIIIVIGYQSKKLVAYIITLKIKTPIIYVNNDIYDRTNNIYSLYLARDYLLQEDTLLLESDLIFNDSVLNKIVKDPYPSLAVVAKYESWMDGSVVTIDDDCNIRSFLTKKYFKFEEIPHYYKTVNVYKFSKSFSETHYVPFLVAYIKALGCNEYYEQVLKVITLLEKPEIKALILDKEPWYEIDDIQDLDIAESIFTTSAEDRYKKIQIRYGGFWRYPGLHDFCYLVNPYFPNAKLLDEIKANHERLICEYPSGMNVNSLLAAKYFGLDSKHIVVGNGASELIKSLIAKMTGYLGIVYPTFDEYPNRKKADEVIAFYSDNNNFSYTAEDLIAFYEDKNISSLLLINPDNPSGNFIHKDDVLKIANWSNKQGITLIVDESFVDFVDMPEPLTLLDELILKDCPNMIIIKSISKSFGVPGLRLGVLASSDEKLIQFLKKDVSIWNINSIAEFFLQILEKYQYEYINALEHFKTVRKRFSDDLSKINCIRVIPSQANYIMCEITHNYEASYLATLLLDRYNIFIKVLPGKVGINGEFVRFSIKKQEENSILISALEDIFSK
jgi:histidinol-phosphate/aromatic aminotransferase/cobyric acid decarboxylase-like protein/choline kinase